MTGYEYLLGIILCLSIEFIIILVATVIITKHEDKIDKIRNVYIKKYNNNEYKELSIRDAVRNLELTNSVVDNYGEK